MAHGPRPRNTDTEALTFPTEMCFAVGYFYPAPKGNLSCFDGVWGG